MASAPTPLLPQSQSSGRTWWAAAGRHWRRALLVATLVTVGVVLWQGYGFLWRHHIKRFQVVRDGVLYRVAQPSEWGFDYLAREYGVQTVVCLKMGDEPLRTGLVDVSPADGTLEAEYVPAIGLQYAHWPIAEKTASWPWFSPWAYEQFFELFDDPANLPVAVHCMAGKHRTGTLCALFRLEYDRWPVERALDEMYSFDFGTPIALQELNLRTYIPRARPTAAEWNRLGAEWSESLGESPANYETLVRLAKQSLNDPKRQPAVRDRLIELLASDEPWAIVVAQRVNAAADEELHDAATAAAARCLADDDAPAADWSMAAAILADHGDEAQQQALLELVRRDRENKRASPRFAAVAVGLVNRYRANRMPYWAALLDDERQFESPSGVPLRYCDLAVVRVATLLGQRWLVVKSPPSRREWEAARVAARKWIDSNPSALTLRTLEPAEGAEGATDVGRWTAERSRSADSHAR